MTSGVGWYFRELVQCNLYASSIWSPRRTFTLKANNIIVNRVSLTVLDIGLFYDTSRMVVYLIIVQILTENTNNAPLLPQHTFTGHGKQCTQGNGVECAQDLSRKTLIGKFIRKTAIIIYHDNTISSGCEPKACRQTRRV